MNNDRVKMMLQEMLAFGFDRYGSDEMSDLHSVLDGNPEVFIVVFSYELRARRPELFTDQSDVDDIASI